MARTKAKKSRWFDAPGKCPGCGLIFTTAALVTRARPGRTAKEGDVTVCTRCGEILVFDVGLAVRRPTVLEMIEIQEAPEWSTVERLARAIKVHKPFQKFAHYAADSEGRVCASCFQRPCRCPDYQYGEEPDGEGGGPGA